MPVLLFFPYNTQLKNSPRQRASWGEECLIPSAPQSWLLTVGKSNQLLMILNGLLGSTALWGSAKYCQKVESFFQI